MIGSLVHNIFGGKRYTIGELMSIDQGRQQKAEYCNVELIDSYFSLREETIAQKIKAQLISNNRIKVFYITFKLRVTSDTGHAHTVLLQIDPDFSLKNWSSNKVRVFCDCNDFKFRSAYILNRRNSLFSNDNVKLALGQALTDAPKSSNGTRTTLLCKHAFAALTWLVNNYYNLMHTL